MRSHAALNTCRLVVVCTYFWSGLQKANGDFIHNVFPFMLGPLAGIVPLQLGFFAPLIRDGDRGWTADAPFSDLCDLCRHRDAWFYSAGDRAVGAEFE